MNVVAIQSLRAPYGVSGAGSETTPCLTCLGLKPTNGWQSAPASSSEIKQHCPQAHNSWSPAFPIPKEVWMIPCETFHCICITWVPPYLELVHQAPAS